MATHTTNYNLTKPGTTDLVDVSILNDNFDIIDEQMKANADAASGEGKQDAITVGALTLTTSWEGTGPYTQAVIIPYSTANSKIDLQPDASVLSRMIADGISGMWVQNNNGTLTVYALGAAPRAEITVQYTMTEIAS